MESLKPYYAYIKKFGWLPVLLAVALIYYGLRLDPPHSSQVIKVSGNVEVTDVEVSFKISGRMDRRLVDEGDKVQAGQLIAVLDTAELVHELGLKQADVAAAEANLLELVNGYLPEEIAQAEAQTQKAAADLTLQQADYSRQKQLFDQKVISPREYDTSKAQFETAQAKYKESNEYFSLLKKGTRVEKINKAEANVQQAKQAFALAEVRLGYANLYSPINGYVLSKNVESGEYVSPGTPVITVGNLDNVWVRAYINETELGKIKLGQKVEVTTDTYPGKIYPGTISYISQQAEFTPKNVQTQKERVKLVYRVKIILPNPDQELKPGMPADGKIVLE